VRGSEGGGKALILTSRTYVQYRVAMGPSEERCGACRQDGGVSHVDAVKMGRYIHTWFVGGFREDGGG